MFTINVIIYGGGKVPCFSELIIDDKLNNSILPIESGFISSIRDGDSHDSTLVTNNNATRGVSRILANI